MAYILLQIVTVVMKCKKQQLKITSFIDFVILTNEHTVIVTLIQIGDKKFRVYFILSRRDSNPLHSATISQTKFLT